MKKRSERRKVFSSALVSLDIVPEEREIVLTVAEPKYLTKYHENLAETVKGFVVHFFRFASTWELGETETKDIDRLYNWLKYTIEPPVKREVLKLLEDLLRSFPLRSEVKVDKLVVKTDSGLENVRSKQKPIRCIIEFNIEIHLSFPQPKPKYEALHTSSEFFEFVYRQIRDLLVNATETVLTQRNIEHGEVVNGPPAREAFTVDLLFTGRRKKETMDFPMRWIFVVSFSEETFPSPEGFTSLFEGIGQNFRRSLSEGISSLLFFLSMVQPTEIKFYEEDSYLRRPFSDISLSRVASSRGLDMLDIFVAFTGSSVGRKDYTPFLIKTLEELKELLEEKEEGGGR